MKTQITTHELECDACHKHFGNDEIKEEDSCPSKSLTIRCKVGLVSDHGYYDMYPQYHLDLGDLCQDCREKLFSIVREEFPHAKLKKMND